MTDKVTCACFKFVLKYLYTGVGLLQLNSDNGGLSAVVLPVGFGSMVSVTRPTTIWKYEMDSSRDNPSCTEVSDCV